MKALCCSKFVEDGLLIVCASLTEDRTSLTMNTVIYDGRFCDVKLYARYTLEPIEIDESVADELYSVFQRSIKLTRAYKHIKNKRKYTQAFNRNHFLPNKWEDLEKLEQEEAQ